MLKHLALYAAFAVIGWIVSSLLSSIAHMVLGIPPGVTFGRFGTLGLSAQIFFWLLPFILSPILLGWVFFNDNSRSATGRERSCYAAGVGLSVFGLFAPFFVVSGAWFGLLQAPLALLLSLLLGIPLVVSVLHGVFFQSTVRLLMFYRFRQGENQANAMAVRVRRLHDSGLSEAEISSRLGLGAAAVMRILERSRQMQFSAPSRQDH